MKYVLILNLIACAMASTAHAEGRKDVVVGKQRYAYDRSPFDRN